MVPALTISESKFFILLSVLLVFNSSYILSKSAAPPSFLKISTIELSKSSDYEGGDLVFDYDRHPMEKTRGTIIIFPSNLYHEVTPVTKGERYSLVQWFKGQKIKKEKK